MARTPQTNLNRASIVRLPEIEKKGESKHILESFGIKRKSISKAAIIEANK